MRKKSNGYKAHHYERNKRCLTRHTKKIKNSALMSAVFYSHSIVAGGLFVMSYTTRLTSRISFVILVDIFSRIENGILEKFAVIASRDSTILTTTGYL